MKIAVLGAGVSGLTVARLLQDQNHDVTVYEKESTPGGLARTRFTDGFLYDPFGGHIFNSKHQEVVDWVFSIYQKEKWQYTARNAKIFFDGKYVSYPFELSLSELDTDEAVDCVYDFLMSHKGPEPSNFRDWLVWNFGQSIADFYMIPYNEKIWAYPLEKMETQWMQGKMPLPTDKDMLRSIMLKDPTERKMPHSTFYYPLQGGIQSMVDAIASTLTIHYDQNINEIKQTTDGWSINQEEEYDHIISTIPLPVLPQVMDLPDTIINCIKDLKYNSLTTVLFECPKTDITWLYIPSHDYRSHRVGYQSALTPNGCPRADQGCGSLEIIGPQFDVTDRFAEQKNILPKQLGYTKSLDSQFTEYAYVIHDLNYRKNIDTIRSFFEKEKGFDLLGRWGTWNYKNMDLCMLDAMQLVKEFK